MANSKSGDSSLDRLVRILGAFDADVPSMTVGVLAVRADVPLATAYRLVDQLIGHEFLRRDSSGGLRLGLGLWELASRSSSALTLREAAMPFMEDIQAVVGQHTQLGVLQNDEVLFIERLSGRESVINQARVAGRLPVHKTSAGVVLLAFSPSHVQDAYLHRHPNAGLPGEFGPGGFRRVLAAVRQQGYAAFDGLVDEHTTGIAVPVLGRGKVAVAALGVVVAQRDGSIQSVLPALLTGARGIARALGERPE
ncbi:IclR family transcriptional regulator [Arthrobacter sp. H14-L1]|uniref:IclR family transcriptional regulator n=1 Tax=Arthrobacter sp. H14-L1 TaxID=2996697 RepID=UPI00226F7B38|nr:IclR family transcriptional regulator C-terminal domain-containing protein [Arthrobacter sp. H14-L1]MCY0905920.1 helix-turn-helix domain-containing protein [Arthrobacter sp. H14-L1]